VTFADGVTAVQQTFDDLPESVVSDKEQPERHAIDTLTTVLGARVVDIIDRT
jgi:hypothetical protein